MNFHQPVPSECLPKGKFKGKTFDEVPQNYLLWMCYDSDYFLSSCFDNLRIDAKNHLLNNFIMPFGKPKGLTIKQAIEKMRSWCEWMSTSSDFECKALQRLVSDALTLFLPIDI